MMKKIMFVGLVGLFLAGCAADTTIPEMPADALYKEGMRLFEKTDYEGAAKYFDEIDRQHPYSEWAARAQIMAAYSFYRKNQYEDAILALDRFIQLHPGNKSTPYAYYLKGLCYYEQMSDIAREQQMADNARDVFEELVARYPNSIYVADAKAKLDLITDNLAGKEMAVGRYYLKDREYLAALNRFQNVLKTYPHTNQVDEAYYRMAVCYVSLGLVDQAEKTYQTQSKKFPRTQWTHKTKELVKKYGKVK